MTSRLEQIEALNAATLSRVPSQAHAAIRQEAHYQMNQRGGRYSGHLAEAVENYRDGYDRHFGSTLARGMLDEGKVTS
jgi:3-deoxy-D-manno-octulosonate 8-phosphate phosphatase KdsC-like HAD superfamily phosphatase